MTISNLPPIPSRSDDPQNFREQADNFVAVLPAFFAEVNAFAGKVNADAAFVAASRAGAASSETVANAQRTVAANSANFKGSWIGKTGAVAPPYAVLHNDRIWILINPISNIAASEPSQENSDWAEFKIYNDIRKPFPLAPLDGATGVLPTLTLEASEYAPSVSIDARLYRRFELSLASDPTFTSPIFTAEVNADTVAVTPDLDLEASYVWRCKDVSARTESPWMDTQGFTVTGAFVVAPTVTVEGSPDDVPESPTLTTSAFVSIPAGDTHLSTDWQVLEGETIVFESLEDQANLLSIKVPTGNLETDTVYIFRARHRGVNFGVSAFTEITAKTVEVFDITPLLAVAHTNSPRITIYNQQIDTFTKLDNPSTLPAGDGRHVDFSNDDVYMAVGSQSSPFVNIYKRDFDVFTKLANPSDLPAGVGLGVAFSNNSIYLAVSHVTTPFVTIYKRDGDTFTKLTNPSDLPAGNGQSVAFSPDNTYLAVGHSTTPFVTIYKRDGDTFTKLANPSNLPEQAAAGIAFSDNNIYLAMSLVSSPFIAIYKRDGDTFTKLANPSDLPAGEGSGAAFSKNNTYLAISHATTPFVTIYKRDGDTFDKLTNPSDLPAGGGSSVNFSSNNTYLAVGHDKSPFVTIYKRDGDTFTKLANPFDLPAGIGTGVAFSKTGF